MATWKKVIVSGADAELSGLSVTGVIAGSINGNAATATSATSASHASEVAFSAISAKPSLVSGSAQVSFSGIADKPALVSGSSQITYSSITGLPTLGTAAATDASAYATAAQGTLAASALQPGEAFGDLGLSVSKGELNQLTGVVLGTAAANNTGDFATAAQGALAASALQPTGDGVVSGSAQISFAGITNKPALVSGSSQITYSAISGLPTLGTAAATAASDYATAAQGATADSALQPGEAFGDLGLLVTKADLNKTNFLTVTEAIDLDAIAADVNNNNAKVGYTDAAVKTYMNSQTVISGSSQVTLASASGNLTASRISDFDTAVAANTAVTANTAKVGVTTASVTAAGALMDSEITNLAQVKNFSSADYATAAQGTLAASALQPGEAYDDLGLLVTKADLNKTNFLTVTEPINLDEVAANVTTNNAKVGYTDAAVKTYMNSQSVVSGSAQVKNLLPSGTVSGSAQITALAPTATGGNLTLSGNLTVNGTTTTVSTTNIEVEDRFAFFNAGGSGTSAEGGIIVESAAGVGNALFYDGVASTRWAFAAGVAKDATAVDPDAFVAAVFVGTENDMLLRGYAHPGNIRVEGGEVFIVTE